MSPICEPHFSDTSYGFRPNRSCEKAIMKLLEYLNDGYEWIVDIDLEKFFDTVPQDRLMSLVLVNSDLSNKIEKDGKKDKFMIYFILKTLLEILKEY
ncbi:GBSi1%2C group II intron%2C maturase [Streptococcus pneumoniae]|nr:GBSi1%2C group II intron%2C maturase [Streptococcus pneumoniae]